MIYGLFAPDERAWVRGADTLREAPLLMSDPRDKLIHELGRPAASTMDTAGRAEVLGQILATCASCHERVLW